MDRIHEQLVQAQYSSYGLTQEQILQQGLNYSKYNLSV